MLFFNENKFEELARNSNNYAILKEAGRDGRRWWYTVEGCELIIGLGIIIYIGLHRLSTVSDYWRKNRPLPLYKYNILLLLQI